MSGIRRPNILLAVFDALSARALHEREGDVPTLAKLRAESVDYRNAYAPNPEAGPARASLFTGLDPFVHGVWTDGVALPDREQTFIQRLAHAGYRTALVGRRQLSGLSRWTTEPLRPGEYSQSDWAHGPLHRSRQNAYLNWLQQMAPETYREIFPVQANPDDTIIPAEQRRAMAEISEALSFNHWVGQGVGKMISMSSAGQPFLCVAGFVVGDAMGAEPAHAAAGETLDERSLQQADNALKHIAGCLAATAQDKHTIVIVCAARGNARIAPTPPPLTEEQLNVPLMVRQPGVNPCVVEPPVSTIDVAPTVLSLAQAPLPPRLQGAVLCGDAQTRGWSLGRQRSEQLGWHTALCIEQWKLVVSHGCVQAGTPSSYRLFNLASDPEERQNLATEAAYAGKLEAMIDKLIDARCAMEDRTEPRIAKF